MIQNGVITSEPRKLTPEEELKALLNLREQKGRMNEYDRIVKKLKEHYELDHYENWWARMAIEIIEGEDNPKHRQGETE
mgnify:CR=1 FL=1